MINQKELLRQAKLHSLIKFIVDEEIEEDLIRIKHIKKLISRLKNGKSVNEKLIINHLIILYNTFESSFVLYALKAVFTKDWVYINTFLVFMKRSLDVINIDSELLMHLRKL